PCATSASPVTKPSALPATPRRSSRSLWKACSSVMPVGSWTPRSTDPSALCEKARSCAGLFLWEVLLPPACTACAELLFREACRKGSPCPGELLLSVATKVAKNACPSICPGALRRVPSLHRCSEGPALTGRPCSGLLIPDTHLGREYSP